MIEGLTVKQTISQNKNVTKVYTSEKRDYNCHCPLIKLIRILAEGGKSDCIAGSGGQHAVPAGQQKRK